MHRSAFLGSPVAQNLLPQVCIQANPFSHIFPSRPLLLPPPLGAPSQSFLARPGKTADPELGGCRLVSHQPTGDLLGGGIHNYKLNANRKPPSNSNQAVL